MLTAEEIKEILAERPNLVLWEGEDGNPEPCPVLFGSPGYQWKDAILGTEITHETTYIQFVSGSYVEITADDWYTWEWEGEVSGVSISLQGAHYTLTDLGG